MEIIALLTPDNPARSARLSPCAWRSVSSRVAMSASMWPSAGAGEGVEGEVFPI
ncbi:hypothetical protein D3C72_2233860 [compost metagenome]